MADEILKRDENHVTVLAGVTDDANQFVTMLRVDPVTKRLLISATGLGSGTVTSVSVVTANGFSGTVATPTSTPAITLSPVISALSIFVANTANTFAQVTPGAGNSIRINAAGNAWEAYTPSTGAGFVTVSQTTPQSIGDTTDRLTKLWATDITVTNAIAGSVTGNAGTVTNATLTTALTVNTGTVTLVGNVANTSVLTIGAGAVSVSGTNTGDQTLPVKATAAELDTGTDDAKFATAKAIKDSKNVPSVAPGTSGNVLTSNGTDWTSAAPSGGGAWTVIETKTPTSGTNIEFSTNLTGYAMYKILIHCMPDGGADTLFLTINNDVTAANYFYSETYFTEGSSSVSTVNALSSAGGIKLCRNFNTGNGNFGAIGEVLIVKSSGDNYAVKSDIDNISDSSSAIKSNRTRGEYESSTALSQIDINIAGANYAASSIFVLLGLATS